MEKIIILSNQWLVLYEFYTMNEAIKV